MTKTICDICGKDMPLELYVKRIENYKFCILSYGKAWDICNECRNELDKWIKKRKAESEKGISMTNGEKLKETFPNGIHPSSGTWMSMEYKESTTKNDLPQQLVKIGDEIYSSMTETKAVVYHIDAWHRYDCFTEDGSSMKLDEHTFNKYWIRTGRNFPQIEAVLHLMKENNNDRTKTTIESNR